MCFSADASFIAAGFLITAGVYSIKKTFDSKNHSFLLLALMPLLFGLQQFTEGFIWLFFGKDPHLDFFLSLIFLFFAFLLWPVWVPLSLGVFDHPRKKFVYIFAFFGLGYGCLLYGSTIVYPTTFNLHLCDHSICYQIHHPMFNPWGVSWYFIFTIFPFFVAQSFRIKILGGLIGISALLTAFFWIHAFTSVWCFFSAVVSLYVAYIAVNLDKIHKKNLR